jgi:RHS repeat-associated protein
VQNLDYLPFGELNSTDSGISTHKFTGRVSGFVLANPEQKKFRQYSSQFARWTSADPAGLAAVDPSNPQSWNRYSYVGNDPMDWIDPFGLYQCPTAALYDGSCLIFGGGGLGPTCMVDGVGTDCGQVFHQFFHDDPFEVVKAASTQTGTATNPECPSPDDCPKGVSPTIPVYGNIGVLALLSLSGNNSSGPGAPTHPRVNAAPTLRFRPPSWQNFTHKYLPCYVGQLTANFFTGDGLVGTAGVVALTVAKPVVGGPVSAVWTGINAFRASETCTLASRAVYE